MTDQERVSWADPAPIGNVGLHGFGLWGGSFVHVVGLVAIIASGFVQGSLETHPGYVHFVEWAGRVGWPVLITAVVSLLVSIILMSIYTIRYGRADGTQGKVVNDGPMKMGLDVPIGRSRRKMLLKRQKFISVESLLDRTTTFGERMIVIGISVTIVRFFLVFVGAALLGMKKFLLTSILFPIPAGLVVRNHARGIWTDYRDAKKKLGEAHSANNSVA